jgi:hypothetical protein
MRKLVRGFHKWLGILIVLQALVWSLSGLMMTLLPEEEVKGDKYLADGYGDALVSEVWQGYNETITALLAQNDSYSEFSVSFLGNELTLGIISIDGSKKIYSLNTGAPLVLDESKIRKIASGYLMGKPEVLFAVKAESGLNNYQGPYPVWKVIVDNPVRSHLYIDTVTGKLLAHQTSYWRWHRYSYNLHLFDFMGAAQVNNLLLSAFAILMLLTAISGLTLLIFSLFRSRNKMND